MSAVSRPICRVSKIEREKFTLVSPFAHIHRKPIPAATFRVLGNSLPLSELLAAAMALLSDSTRSSLAFRLTDDGMMARASNQPASGSAWPSAVGSGSAERKPSRSNDILPRVERWRVVRMFGVSSTLLSKMVRESDRETMSQDAVAPYSQVSRSAEVKDSMALNSGSTML